MSKPGLERGGAVLLYTALNRAALFTWQQKVMDDNPGLITWLVDTWEIPDHPTPGGETFTLYACTIVLTDGRLISEDQANQMLHDQARNIGERMSAALDRVYTSVLPL